MVDIPMPSFSLGQTQPTSTDTDIPTGSTALVPIYLAAGPQDPAIATRTPPPPTKLLNSTYHVTTLTFSSADHQLIQPNWVDYAAIAHH